jgi:hypothetical protein
VLWLIPSREQPVALANTTAAGATNTTATDTLGDEHLNRHIISGGRLTVGYWLTQRNPWVPGGQLPCLGVETRFFFVGQRSVTFTDSQSPIIARPFFDLNDQKPSAVIVAAPGLASGSISATAKENLWGGEANLWKILHFADSNLVNSVEGMVGLRYIDLNESIGVSRLSSFVSNPQGFPTFASLVGNSIFESESLGARNQFWGGQVGLRGRVYLENIAIITSFVQLGLGSTNEEINIQGTQTRKTQFGQTIVSPGALLALPTNIGRFHENKFTQVPELGINVAFPLTNHLTVSAGFNALYWSRLIHPESQVDRTVDITQIPSFPGAATAVPTGLQRPTVPFSQSNLWLLGTLVSAEVKW